MLPFYCVLLAMFGVICKAIQLVCNTFFSSIGTQWNDNCEEKIGIISIDFCCPFHSLILRSTILTTPMDVL